MSILVLILFILFLPLETLSSGDSQHWYSVFMWGGRRERGRNERDTNNPEMSTSHQTKCSLFHALSSEQRTTTAFLNYEPFTRLRIVKVRHQRIVSFVLEYSIVSKPTHCPLHNSWDSLYDRENTNFNDFGDIGEVW